MRSVLFAGATRPDLVRKLHCSGPDAVVIDLEDAVPAGEKKAAREAARALGRDFARAHAGIDVYVRVNAPATRWFDADVALGLDPALAGVMVPKTESKADVDRLNGALAEHGLEHLEVFVGLETARGVAYADEILATAVVHAAYFGAEDYIADLGGRRTPEGLEVLYARSRVTLFARVHGVVSIDIADVDLRDADAFRAGAEQGRALGYHGKLCVHPRQVGICNTVFGAGPEACARAEQMLAAADEAARAGIGAIEFEGSMVDEPALRMARTTLARARRTDP